MATILTKAERCDRRRRVLCPGARSQARSACVIARRRRVSIRPKVLLAVGELFVRAQSARSQAPVLLPAVDGFQFEARP